VGLAALGMLGEELPEKFDCVLVDAFEQHTGDEVETIRCESFAEANDWIAENAKSGDVVLLENDLPDLYERRLGI